MSEFSVAPIFTDNCVLQQNKPISVWGTGENGKRVSAFLDGVTSETIIKNGEWQIFLPPMKAKNDLELMIKCGEEAVTLYDVAIGEVWLAGGQSNMEFELRNSTGGREMMESDNPNVRFFYTPKYEYEAPKFEHMLKDAHWADFSDEWKGAWSAVGYCFAKHLSETLGVTVGVIGCNWGGTSASAWMREEDLRGDRDLSVYYDEYDKNTAGRTFEEQVGEYEEYLDFRHKWDADCAKLYEENPQIEWDEVEKILGPANYPGKVNACNPVRPAGIYHTMLSKVIKYTMAGVIYYQGESDDHLPKLYYRLFKRLVLRWREDNGDMMLPFIATQLPMHRYRQDPDYKHWAIIRRSQRRVADDLPVMGLGIILDQGQWNDIHPKDKREVGRRLALQALWLVYGKLQAKEANPPRISNVVFTKNGAEVFFDYAETGLVVSGDEIKGFELASNPEEFVAAGAEIIDGQYIKLTCEEVPNPKYIRYLWTNWGDVTLYGTNGICVEPYSNEEL
ncbi:MAG: sialate O-acetylesterase [Lachnospiraceae bacterium]|nr:sialate O-acetylesterase [Lachnospiraceae bacterium]